MPFKNIVPSKGKRLVAPFLTLWRRRCSESLENISASELSSEIAKCCRRMLRREAVSEPPHRLSLYKETLVGLLEDDFCSFLSIKDRINGRINLGSKYGVCLRHDIDCGSAKRTEALCAVESALNLRSSVHFLVDDVIYDLNGVRETAKRLHGAGFDVGLHSQCWLQENYELAFEKELERFSEVFGFRAETYSQHGAWPRDAGSEERRAEMRSRERELAKRHSLVGCDYKYDIVIEDSARLGKPVPINEDFRSPERYICRGDVALLLTHDCYWTED